MKMKVFKENLNKKKGNYCKVVKYGKEKSFNLR